MFRKFRELIITPNSVYVEVEGKYGVDVKKYEFPETAIPFGTFKKDECFMSYSTRDTVCIQEGQIVCYKIDENPVIIECPKELLHYIQKDISKKGEFKLSYRKHLSWKYDKRHVRIVFMPGCSPIVKNKVDELKDLYRGVAFEYGKGFVHRPLIVFSSFYIGLHYKVLDDKMNIVAWGSI